MLEQLKGQVQASTDIVQEQQATADLCLMDFEALFPCTGGKSAVSKSSLLNAKIEPSQNFSSAITHHEVENKTGCMRGKMVLDPMVLTPFMVPEHPKKPKSLYSSKHNVLYWLSTACSHPIGKTGMFRAFRPGPSLQRHLWIPSHLR